MAERVKAKRRYDSSRRRAQAAATRVDILDAAQRLFEERGYAATTMEAIAAETGVALKTVRLRAGQDEVPIADQEWYREVVAERDPQEKIRRTAQSARAAKERIGGVLRVIRTAAPIDPDIAALWNRIESDFHANQRVIVESLAATKALRRGLDVDRAADLLWTLNHPDVWHLLVDQRGWTPEEWETWFRETACAQLLR
jgi:AcrR family transcriptional regulator